jgi:hypothetical protein
MQNSPHKDNFSETITLLDTKVSDVLSTVSNICADRHTVLELSREAKSDLCGQQPAIVNFRKALQVQMLLTIIRKAVQLLIVLLHLLFRIRLIAWFKVLKTLKN